MPYRKYTICDNIERLMNAGALSEAVYLTDDGVVKFPGGWMHPNSFRVIVGEAAYQTLLARLRVPSPYPEVDERPGHEPKGNL